MLSDEPKGWRCLQEMAQRERDPQRLAVILDQLNHLLDEHERTAATRDSEEPTEAAGGSPAEAGVLPESNPDART
jgi:hypothetical protein